MRMAAACNFLFLLFKLFVMVTFAAVHRFVCMLESGLVVGISRFGIELGAFGYREIHGKFVMVVDLIGKPVEAFKELAYLSDGGMLQNGDKFVSAYPVDV